MSRAPLPCVMRFPTKTRLHIAAAASGVNNACDLTDAFQTGCLDSFHLRVLEGGGIGARSTRGALDVLRLNREGLQVLEEFLGVLKTETRRRASTLLRGFFAPIHQ